MDPIGPELLGQLFDQHAPALTLYARQWVDSPEDIVQVAFIELARQRQCPANPAAWLFGTVRNQALTAARSRKRRRTDEGAAAQRTDWFVETPEARLDAAMATQALNKLSDQDREIVVSRLWGGLTFAEIGHLVGVTDSTAQRRYCAALNQLREHLEPLCRTNSNQMP